LPVKVVSVNPIPTSTLDRTSGLLEHAAGSVGDLLVDGAELVGVLALLLLKRVDALFGYEYGGVGWRI
jgi:hypothetical protein